MRALRTLLALSFFSVALLSASSAQAVWQIYGTGEFGYSIGVADVAGEIDVPFIPFAGSDDDVSPMLSGAIGIQIPIRELTPWRMPGNRRLVDWPFRFEIQFAGLREYEYKTPGPDTPVRTDVKIWSMMNNFWFDIPLQGLHRPIAWTSGKVAGRPRLPTLKRFLEPASFYFGVGVGFASTKLQAGEFRASGTDESIDFAYQVGTGFGYQLTERVNLGVGYRYFQPGKKTVDLSSNVEVLSGSLRIDTDIHEATFAIRILLFDLPYPWR